MLTILSLLFFVMLLSMGGLAVDLGRLYNLRGQMQAYVDHAALSAASQLDRSSDSITRAYRAVISDGTSQSPLITGSQSFAIGSSSLSIDKVTFLQTLDPDWKALDPTPAPNDDVLCTYQSGAWTPTDCNTDAATNENSQFVEVVAAPRGLKFLLLPLLDFIGQFFGAPAAPQYGILSTRATAGFRLELCDSAPLMMCNPDEAVYGSGSDFDTDGRDDGKQIHAKYSGTASSLAPGMFGLLSVYGGNSASQLRDALAQVNPNTACSGDTVQAKNGEATGPTLQGMDVRFDMYSGPMNKNDPNNAPAPNVTKGLKDCTTTRSSATMPFPRDACFMVSPTPGAGTGCVTLGGGARMGAGDWSPAAYWLTNHGASLPAALGTNPSRYDVYRYEIEQSQLVNLGNEHGAPTCYTGSQSAITTDPNLDRRVLLMAVVNCQQYASQLSSNGPIPVKAYAKVFLTEPVANTNWTKSNETFTRGGLTWGGTNPDDIYAEIIGVVHMNDSSGKLHEFPVLYR